MLTPEKAQHVLDSHQLLGPTLLFAAVTGLLLFASSIVAGWVENWFVLHKLDSAIAYNPTITRRLGQRLALRCSHFMRTHVSGLAANISLGLMLGLVPAIAGFFGLELEVRHVTLVMGQLTAAVMALGWTVWLEPAFWSALAAMLLVGPINLAVSFYLAFRLALKARSVSDVNRQRIQGAIRHRLRRAPLSFLWPVSAQQETQAHADVDIAPPETNEDEPPDGRV
jgi:site-specific recombinase